MNSSETIALLFGAGIALFSSILTTAVAALVSHWLARRLRRQDKVARLHHLFGKVAVGLARDKELIEAWREQRRRLDNFVSQGDDYDIEGLIGLAEGLESSRVELQGKLRDLENALESRDQRLLVERRELATGHIMLQNQLRDALMGYSQREQDVRARAMGVVLAELDDSELMAIINQQAPLPTLSGLPGPTSLAET